MTAPRDIAQSSSPSSSQPGVLLGPEDTLLIEQIENGGTISSWQEAGGRFKELATGILLQFADSQMAGAAGFAPFINRATTIEDRLNMSTMVSQKLSMAKDAYEVIGGLNFNVDRYLSSHCFESRVLRDSFLGFSRSSADKRLNALLYPLEGFEDMLVFTYLLGVMARLMLGEFADAKFIPLKELACSCLPLETAHANFALLALRRKAEAHKKQIELSYQYWYPRVETSAGPTDSVRNQWHKRFGLKHSDNLEIKEEWKKEVSRELQKLALEL